MIEYITEEVQKIPLKERRQVEKKILPEYYKGIVDHTKNFEIRYDDDNVHPGDILVLREWDGEKYTGASCRREVTAVLRETPEYGLTPGYAIYSLKTPGFNRSKACLDSIEQLENKNWNDTFF